MYDKTNKKLRFNGDGNFRILMISDFHAGERRKGFEDGNPYSPKVKEAIEALVTETNPDFVMVGGDQCIGKSPEYLYNSMTDIMSPVLDRNSVGTCLRQSRQRDGNDNKTAGECLRNRTSLLFKGRSRRGFRCLQLCHSDLCKGFGKNRIQHVCPRFEP